MLIQNASSMGLGVQGFYIVSNTSCRNTFHDLSVRLEGTTMTRKLLSVGINYYQHTQPLHGCVNDAKQIASVLMEHEVVSGNVSVDSSSDSNTVFDNNVAELTKTNFITEKLVATGHSTAITRGKLKDAVTSLFDDAHDLSLIHI